MSEDRATLEEVLEFANAVREAGGGNPIDALMPAVPGDADQCLIAKNLNFNCQVAGGPVQGIWYMYISDHDIATRIAEKLELELDSAHRYRGYDNKSRIELPVRIGNVARDFDKTEDVLDHLIGEVDERCMGKSGDVEYRDALVEAWNALDTEKKNLINEMMPYIEESVREAYDIASIVNEDGSIVL